MKVINKGKGYACVWADEGSMKTFICLSVNFAENLELNFQKKASAYNENMALKMFVAAWNAYSIETARTWKTFCKIRNKWQTVIYFRDLSLVFKLVVEELLKVVWRLNKTKRHSFYNDSIKTSEDGGGGVNVGESS